MGIEVELISTMALFESPDTFWHARLAPKLTSRARRVRATHATADASADGAALKPELKAAIDKFVTDNKVVLFMKGTKQFPQCGFSNTCVEILKRTEVPFETVNILEDEEGLRAGMKVYSSWPTFPQCYISGELFGGCDIMLEAYQDGTLLEELEAAVA